MALGALAHYRKLVHCEFPIFLSMADTQSNTYFFYMLSMEDAKRGQLLWVRILDSAFATVVRRAYEDP